MSDNESLSFAPQVPPNLDRRHGWLARVTGTSLARACGGERPAQGRPDRLRRARYGAALQALQADPNVKLWAMGDAFADRLQSSLRSLSASEAVAAKIDCAAGAAVRRLRRLQAGHRRVRRGAALLAARFSAAASEGGGRGRQARLRRKAGGRRCPRRAQRAGDLRSRQSKRAVVVSGLCLRYDWSYQETVKRIHDGRSATC